MRTGENHDLAGDTKGFGQSLSSGLALHVRPYWRWARALIAVLVVIACVPSVAFATDEQVIISDAQVFTPNSNEIKSGYFVLAYSEYNAALLALGFSPNDSRLTNDVKAKLSNQSTGGNFYLYAQSFARSQNATDLPSWAAGSGYFGTIWQIYASDTDFGLYYSAEPDYFINLARVDLNKVLSGEDLGGGGSGSGEFPNPLIFDGVGKVYDNGQVKDATEFTLNLDEYTLNGYGNDKGFNDYEYDNIYGFVVANLRDQSANIVNIYVYKTDGTITYTQVPLSKKQIYDKVQQKFVEVQTYTYKINITGASYVYIHEDYQGGYNSAFGSRTLGWIVPTEGNTATQISHEGTAIYTYNGETKPVTPPTNWPTDPTPTPVEPPEVPEPPTTTPPTQPTPPTSPTPPTYITKPTYTYNTYTADLQGVLDAMHEHCMHLQQALYDNFAGLYDVLIRELDFQFNLSREQETSNFGWLGSVIGGYFTDLSDYLRELFEWLAGQFDFSFTAPGYDDGSLISWLKKIYSKLGTGPVNTRPVDPVTDPKGVGDWLGQLLSNFISALLGIGVGAIGGVAQNFQQLTTKFPFCVPWDIAAMIGIMVATPEPPIYDVPIMCLTAEGLQQVGQWHIDCSAFDPYMGGIRTMETVAFAFALCFKTDFFKQAVGVVTGKGK